MHVACRQLGDEYLRVLSTGRLQREVRPMLTADKDRELMAILQQVSQGQMQVQQALRRNELHVPESQPTQFTSPQRFQPVAAALPQQHSLPDAGADSSGIDGSGASANEQLSASQPASHAAGQLLAVQHRLSHLGRFNMNSYMAMISLAE